MAQPRATYSLSELHLFRTFTTIEEYRKATGEYPPPYDPAKPPKAWFDPTALQSVRRTVVYDSVLAIGAQGQVLADAAGKPMLDILALSKEDAAQVNIWHDQSGQPVPAVPPVPMPLRQLKPNEELFFLYPQVVAVRDTTVEAETGMFTGRDRVLLRQIAEKLGINPV
jgi:hypothetical protein